MILGNFTQKPQHSESFCKFLSHFPNDKKVQKFLLSFINSKENIYEQQFLHVLRALLEIKINLPKNIIKQLIKIFKDKNSHWAVRSLCALLIGERGIQQDKELLVDEFCKSDLCELKQNIILSVQGLGTASKNDFFNTISKDDPDIEKYTKYVKSFKKSMYFRPYDRIKIENFAIEFEVYY